MIQLLPDFPTHVVAMVASGQVTSEDYETVVIPAIESALKTHEHLRLLYRLGSGFSGFSPGAMWEDMQVGLAHLKSWERIAVVTDEGWVAGAVRLFGFAIPCPVKVFANEHFAEASAWIVAA